MSAILIRTLNVNGLSFGLLHEISSFSGKLNECGPNTNNSGLCSGICR